MQQSGHLYKPLIYIGIFVFTLFFESLSVKNIDKLLKACRRQTWLAPSPSARCDNCHPDSNHF
jgi:hypothetical protein